MRPFITPKQDHPGSSQERMPIPALPGVVIQPIGHDDSPYTGYIDGPCHIELSVLYRGEAFTSLSVLRKLIPSKYRHHLLAAVTKVKGREARHAASCTPQDSGNTSFTLEELLFILGDLRNSIAKLHGYAIAAELKSVLQALFLQSCDDSREELLYQEEISHAEVDAELLSADVSGFDRTGAPLHLSVCDERRSLASTHLII